MENFVKKSSEELSKLTEEETLKYFADLSNWQTESIEALTEASKKEDADLEGIKSQLEELYSSQIKTLTNSIETQGGELAKMAKELEAKSEGKPLGFTAAILKSLDENKEDIAKMVKDGSKKIRLDIKAEQGAGDITSGTDFAMMENGVGQIATRRPFMKDLFRTVNTNKEYIKYNDQETIVRDAKNVAACATSTHLSKITWQVRTLQISKVRDFVDVCIDMMDDYDFVEGEIRNLISTDVALKVDEQLLLGDNVYPNLNSVDAVSSTFAAGSYATSVQDAQLIDLVYVVACQIADFGQNNKFMADTCLMNPADACLMQLIKDVDGNYLMPNWITQDGINIGAVRIIANPLVPAGEMYVFDSTKGVIYSRRGASIELGFENNDNFERELVTVKGYERLNFRVRNVDANAFTHVPDIATAITAITKP
jgi:hypothetical protein